MTPHSTTKEIHEHTPSSRATNEAPAYWAARRNRGPSAAQNVFVASPLSTAQAALTDRGLAGSKRLALTNEAICAPSLVTASIRSSV